MGNWKGLDSGGTEQLWQPDILLEMLGVLKSHEPFSTSDSNSPIFDDLEDLYPDITWRNYDRNNSFRPIFRKCNPLAKLGLIEASSTNGSLTPLGDEVLSGTMTLGEVYENAAKYHTERDGTLSMSMMCSAVLEYPDHTFTLEDVEFGISTKYDPNLHNCKFLVDYVQQNHLTFSQGDTTRRRRIRDFYQVLVYANALSQTSDGWFLNDKSVAQNIASSVLSSVAPSNKKPLSLTTPAKVSSSTPDNLASTSVKKIDITNNRAIEIRPALESNTDPA